MSRVRANSSIPLDAYECVCQEGFTTNEGDCVDTDECANGPCQNGGVCTESSSAAATGAPVAPALYRCNCAIGYEGDDCELDIDECASKPCLNGAHCADRLDAFLCLCEPGYVNGVCYRPPPLYRDLCDATGAVTGGTCDVMASRTSVPPGELMRSIDVENL